MRHYESDVLVKAEPEAVFAFIDDHERFSSHMNSSSWMMAGSRMQTSVDDQHGRAVGSHIRMAGRVLGKHLTLDEVVTVEDPPRRKAWETVGEPDLLVVGNYAMAVTVEPLAGASRVTVGIDYDLPRRRRWLGRLLGGWYARWCVGQMTKGVQREFAVQQ